ncbi:hypothetical protein NT2_05_01980 [Caenibius tardaugens NBRC 16725]|uniref:DUF2141 domain-containing protein n=1 Tax=Caenibius tardaugens NBRC 16725 TaxID=1219035 RepID=U3A3F0_9SPHN|nr:DUF2141 domain-containing protein [Caenibius tardaugens]AZI36625.1 DUF2141 domain-containing protein [Caenibius tardaugens NBRC 16725]GAD49278.1 hypothetical protein NT2_05_01980 [Caenibius tardaugens NBRC 16725]
MIPLLFFAAALQSTPDLGKAEGRCRANETGPAFLVEVGGLKDRKGQLKLEVYPANDKDFLQDDNILIMEHKVFRRVEVPVPARGPVQLCIRIPGPGTYAVSLLHDRDSNRKFGLSVDGIGFSNNPRLGMSKPKAAAVAISAGSTLTHVRIVMNYRSGLVSFSPLRK